jgi:hypothetical protein
MRPLKLLVPAAAATALALALLLLPAPAAEAGCGGVRYLPAKKKPKRGRPPLAIGDSTMLLAMPYLARDGWNVDAHGCRGMDEGLALLRRRRARHRLPHLVTIALGADFAISRRQIRVALHVLGPGRVLGLVTPWELGGHAGADARAVRSAAAVYRRRVLLLDWVRFSRGHGAWFQPDGVHLTLAGARAFARLFRRALPLAAPPARG